MDLADFKSELSLGNKIARVLWALVWLTAFRPSPRPFFFWRRFLLRLFGARIGRGVRVYGSARIWLPSNLTVGDHSVIGWEVRCYCVAPIRIGAHVIVSQYAHLCAATHDHRDPSMPLRPTPISIADRAWVCADAFVGPGVSVGEGAILGARGCAFRDVPPWTIAGGNPAREISRRERPQAS